MGNPRSLCYAAILILAGCNQAKADQTAFQARMAFVVADENRDRNAALEQRVEYLEQDNKRLTKYIISLQDANIRHLETAVAPSISFKNAAPNKK